ncbi:hypothetical protein SM017_003541 [Cronobacter turicensis]|nr:hypothetical protein [Cronobacter turicensis]
MKTLLTSRCVNQRGAGQKDAYELKLDELKKDGKVSTKKYQEGVQKFCEEREKNLMVLNIFWLKVHSC